MLYPKIIPLFAPAGCQRSLFKRLCQPKTLSTILANYFRLNSDSAGANFYFEQTELEVCFVAPDLVRIEWKGGLLAVSYAIARHDWQEVETKLEQTGDLWTVSTAALQVIVKLDGSLTFCDESGQTIRENYHLNAKITVGFIELVCGKKNVFTAWESDRFHSICRRKKTNSKNPMPFCGFCLLGRSLFT